MGYHNKQTEHGTNMGFILMFSMVVSIEDRGGDVKKESKDGVTQEKQNPEKSNESGSLVPTQRKETSLRKNWACSEKRQ